MSRADILVVDDTPQNLRLLSNILTKEGYQVRQALSGKMAMTAVQAVPPDLILLDIMMPDMDGYTFCQALKAKVETAAIPVIFLSALTDGSDKAKAFTVGGADYISKPFHLEEVIARVQNQLALLAAETRNQQLSARLEERVKERTHQLELANRELYREILERKVLQSQLLELATHDALTGLPNRALFIDRTKQALDALKSDPTARFAVLFLDCDRFKVVNDSLGHFVGDQLLVAIAGRLVESLHQPTAVLARLGGDEFTVLLTEFATVDEVIQTVQQMLSAFHQPFQLGNREVFITASVGVAIGNSEYSQPEHVLRDADMAMYRAKKAGNALYQIFDPTLHQNALQRLQLEIDLRKAIHQQELIVHYQPIVAIATGKIVGLEALVRWLHPQHGLISPMAFIPIAEETGLIAQIGYWVMSQSCQQLRQWQANITDSPLTVSVNLSARQFAQADLVAQIDQILAETRLSPECLKLEITESTIMENAQTAAGILQELRKRQIQLSLDDFGTGYSSLSYLHSFPVDTLKIDRSFVQRMGEQAGDLGLVPLIINIAHKMGMNVVAEGIETQEQLDHLRTLNCDFGQGFFFFKPMDGDQLSAILHSTGS